MSSNNITIEPAVDGSSANISSSASASTPSNPPSDNTSQTNTSTEPPKINISLMPEEVDNIVKAVINHYTQRTNAGLDKNGKPMDRSDMSIIKWMHHAQEELMDNIIYIEKLKQMYIYKARAMSIFLEEQTAKFNEEESNTHSA